MFPAHHAHRHGSSNRRRPPLAVAIGRKPPHAVLGSNTIIQHEFKIKHLVLRLPSRRSASGRRVNSSSSDNNNEYEKVYKRKDFPDRVRALPDRLMSRYGRRSRREKEGEKRRNERRARHRLLQSRVDLRHVVVIGEVPPVAACLRNRGRHVQLLHLFGVLEDVDVHSLRSMPCHMAV